MVQSVQCLQILGAKFNPENGCKKLVMVIHICTLVPGENRGRRIAGVHWLDSLSELVSSRSSETPCLKTMQGMTDKGRKVSNLDFLPSHLSTHVCTCSHMCMHKHGHIHTTHPNHSNILKSENTFIQVSILEHFKVDIHLSSSTYL